MAYLNLGSFLLGLVSWILPIVNLLKYDKAKHKNWSIISVLSLSTCAISLLMQLFYSHYLVMIEDWSALLDTTNAVVLASSVLLFVTLVLNIITFVVYKDHLQK